MMLHYLKNISVPGEEATALRTRRGQFPLPEALPDNTSARLRKAEPDKGRAFERRLLWTLLSKTRLR